MCIQTEIKLTVQINTLPTTLSCSLSGFYTFIYMYIFICVWEKQKDFLKPDKFLLQFYIINDSL